MEDKCEFYPGPNDGCVCAAGSDISGHFVCTKEYSNKCQWVKELRRFNQIASLKEQELLMKLIFLATPRELPKGFLENHNRIWEAFNLGRKYEKEVKNND